MFGLNEKKAGVNLNSENSRLWKFGVGRPSLENGNKTKINYGVLSNFENTFQFSYSMSKKIIRRVRRQGQICEDHFARQLEQVHTDAAGLPFAVSKACRGLRCFFKDNRLRGTQRAFFEEGGRRSSKGHLEFASISLGRLVGQAGSMVLNPGSHHGSTQQLTIDSTEDLKTMEEEEQIPTTIEFVNDPKHHQTVVTIHTKDKDGLLLELCSAFRSLGLSVHHAEISTLKDGSACDCFQVRDEKGGQIRVEQWDLVRTRLLASCRRRGGKGWREKDRKLKQIFRAMDPHSKGHITQEDVNKYAAKLRLPAPFVAEFVQENDQNEQNQLCFEEFAASVRSKEALLYTVFDQIDSKQRGYVGRRHLESGLRNLELRTGRYGKRKKISKAGVVKLMKLLDQKKYIDREEFRDLFIMLPSKELVTVSPYYMKVGLDIGRVAPPDRRKDGPPWGHFVAGGLAGIVSKSLASPLNVVAIRMATSTDLTGSAFQRMPMAIKAIWKAGGLKGFWRGNFTNSLSSAPGKAIDFFAYALMKELLSGDALEPTDWQRFLAGACAGIASDGILYPLEVVSTRMAVGGQYNGAVHAISSIFKKEGIKGFYAGLGSALIGVVPYAGCSFAAYDILSTSYRKYAHVESAGILPTFLCGLASGWLASTISFPLYNVTLRLQAQSSPQMYTSMLQAFRVILATQGVSGLFQGYLPATLKMIPMSGASFATYEFVKRRLKDRGHDNNDDENDDQDDHHIQTDQIAHQQGVEVLEKSA